MGWIPLDFHGIWPYKTSETWICLLFYQYWGWVQKKSMISPLLIYNKFRYHTHKIRLEKLVPLNYRFPTDNKKSSNEIDQTVLKLDFWQKSRFPKIRDLSPVAPRGVYISRNDTQNIFFWKCKKTSKVVIFWQNGYLFYAFSRFSFSPWVPWVLIIEFLSDARVGPDSLLFFPDHYRPTLIWWIGR